MFDKLIYFLLIIVFGVIGCFNIIVLYDMFMAETFSLNKSEWKCIETRKDTRYVSIGKVVVPQNYDECTAYIKIKK